LVCSNAGLSESTAEIGTGAPREGDANEGKLSGAGGQGGLGKNAGVRRNDANAEVRSENSEVKRENANSESSAPFAYFWALTSEF
jgi:hypothetical protein